MAGRNICHKDRAAQQSRGGTEHSSSEGTVWARASSQGGWPAREAMDNNYWAGQAREQDRPWTLSPGPGCLH